MTTAWAIFLLIVILLFTLVSGAVLIMLLVGALITDAPFVPVPSATLKEIVKALELKSDSIFYDIGSGEGRVLLVAAPEVSNGKCIGIEKAPFPYVLSLIRRQISGHTNIELRREDMFDTDLSNATHIFAYLFPRVLRELEPKLERELKPGTRFVTCDFKFSRREPIKVIDMGRSKHALGRKLNVYEF